MQYMQKIKDAIALSIAVAWIAVVLSMVLHGQASDADKTRAEIWKNLSQYWYKQSQMRDLQAQITNLTQVIEGQKAELRKACGGDIDEDTLDCKAKPAEPKK